MMDDSSDELIYGNGIDGASGGYLAALGPAKKLAAAIRARRDGNGRDGNGGDDPPPRPKRKGQLLGTRYGVDADKLEEAGWAVAFAPGVDPAVARALRPLLDHRREQAGRVHPHRYRELSGEESPQPGETWSEFSTRHRCPIGAADPDRLPFYLLLVGSPEQIPHAFQHQADVDYAVGRLCLETPEDFAAYATTVLAAETDKAETGEPPAETVPRRLAFFGSRNPDDPATRKSADYLIQPLSEAMGEAGGVELRTRLGEAATKAALARLLGGGETPDLLFCATHGMGFPRDEPRQLPHQGAILCQDWPGPERWQGPIPASQYFSADDLADDARLAGLIAFQFACYGGGTPRWDTFFHRDEDPAAEIAPEPFTSRLSRRLLCHPRGGAQAVVAHVDRCWGWSFLWPEMGSQIDHFQNALRMLLDGRTVGHAMEPINERYASLATRLVRILSEIDFGKQVEDKELIRLWTAVKDAGGWLLLGDPAVRLPPPGREPK